MSFISDKILLFARDPGGVNVIFPLIDRLRDNGYVISLFGKDISLARFKRYGFNANDVTKQLKSENLDSVIEFLKRESPKFVITGTSENEYIEKYLWAGCEALDLPCIAILDSWANFGVRFSPYRGNQLDLFNEDRKITYLPTKILVPDDFAREKIIQEGIPAERILVSGHPYFDYLLEIKDTITNKELRKVRKKYGCEEDSILIIFSSENITTSYELTGMTFYWGYTEKTIFQEIARALLKLEREKLDLAKIVIRPHPQDKPGNFSEIVEKYQKLGLEIEVDSESNPYEVIMASNLVIGMSSMFLLEAALFGKPIISVQIGLKRENIFILHNKGITSSILDPNELFLKLREIFDGNYPKLKLDFKYGSVEKVIEIMEAILCQS